MSRYQHGSQRDRRSEIDLLLSDQFRQPRGRRGPGLGENIDPGDINNAGLTPSLAASSQARRNSVLRSDQTPTGGPTAAMKDLLQLDPAVYNEMSRMLEQTFRNFQLHSRPPSHIAPPFVAKPIDAFPSAPVSIPSGDGTQAFTTVISQQVSMGAYRGEIVAAGQSAESQAAWNGLEWQLTVDGTPVDPWRSVKIQLWQMCPVTPLAAPLHLLGGQTIALKARVTDSNGSPYKVLGRLFGWFYPTRAETGNAIGSTLVD